MSALPNHALFTVEGQVAAPTAFLIDGSNYIKLRDIAAMLADTEKGFAVAYDLATDSVALAGGRTYTPLGTELAGVRDAAVVQAGAGSQQITLDGAPLTLTAYMIDDENYVKLRDLAQAIDCGITYDPATQAVDLNPSLPYEA